MKRVDSLPSSTNEKQESPANLNHGSSVSSTLPSPFATRFSMLTNYIPFSWAPRASQSGAAAVTLRLIPDGSSGLSHPAFDDHTNSSDDKDTRGQNVVEIKRKYVSKEDQLEKLRSRLAQEMTVRGPIGICRTCGDEMVSL